MFKWIPGRQNGGYFKMPLLCFKKFDSYILKFEEGSYVLSHVDNVKSGRHYRLNVFLRKPKTGGLITIEGKPIFNNRFFQLFRPDIQRHRMNCVQEGKMLILSFGIVL